MKMVKGTRWLGNDEAMYFEIYHQNLYSISLFIKFMIRDLEFNLLRINTASIFSL